MKASKANPDLGLQTRLSARRAFEGWYFKHASKDLQHVWSVIVGIALERERFAFIQLIDGRSGWSRFVRYDLADFIAQSDDLNVRLGPNHFSREGIRLDVIGDDFRCRGEIHYSNPTAWIGRGLGSTIMGPFRHVPLMECRHGVFSLDHGLDGWIELETNINSTQGPDSGYAGQTLHLGDQPPPPSGRFIFTDGRGYAEKDWGLSFPSSYLWLQGNCFDSGPGTSVMLSIARIPSLGTHFTGHLGFVLHQGRQYHFATWNGTKLVDLKADAEGNARVELVRKVRSEGTYRLTLVAKTAVGGLLKAPKLGVMANLIKESLDAELDIRLELDDQVVLSGRCRRCGMEMVGQVQDLKKAGKTR